MEHLPFLHQYKFIKVHHYYDTSWGGRAKSTRVVWGCRCGKLKIKDYYGLFLTEEELTTN